MPWLSPAVTVYDGVKLNPTAFRELERIFTDRLDFQPSIIFIDRTVRVVHVAIDQLDAVPIKPPAPPSLGLGATHRLVAHVMEAKYCHHRPHYRTEGIFKVRHGVDIPRHTFCHWDKVVAEILEPLSYSGMCQAPRPQPGSLPRRRAQTPAGHDQPGRLQRVAAVPLETSERCRTRRGR